MKNFKKDEKNNIEFTVKFNKTKLLKAVGVTLAVIFILGLAFIVSNNTSQGYTSYEYTNINIDQYLELLNGSEKAIVYVARPDCSWCQKQSPIMKKLGREYNLTINYFNANDAYQDEEVYEKFTSSSEKYQGDWGTPNTIIVQGGEIIDGIFGYAERSNLKDLFIRNGFIDE